MFETYSAPEFRAYLSESQGGGTLQQQSLRGGQTREVKFYAGSAPLTRRGTYPAGQPELFHSERVTLS